MLHIGNKISHDLSPLLLCPLAVLSPLLSCPQIPPRSPYDSRSISRSPVSTFVVSADPTLAVLSPFFVMSADPFLAVVSPLLSCLQIPPLSVLSPVSADPPLAVLSRVSRSTSRSPVSTFVVSTDPPLVILSPFLSCQQIHLSQSCLHFFHVRRSTSRSPVSTFVMSADPPRSPV